MKDNYKIVFTMLISVIIAIHVGFWIKAHKSPAMGELFSSGAGANSSLKTQQPAPIYTLDDLLDAIEQIESGGDASAIGKDGEVGSFQIKKIFVDDVTRIIKMAYPDGMRLKPSYEARLDRVKSRAMAYVYIWYYSWHNIEGMTLEKLDHLTMKEAEYMARIFNGGPTGHKKECTKAYWLKVKAELER